MQQHKKDVVVLLLNGWPTLPYLALMGPLLNHLSHVYVYVHSWACRTAGTMFCYSVGGS